jgi:hypothetical protein
MDQNRQQAGDQDHSFEHLAALPAACDRNVSALA